MAHNRMYLVCRGCGAKIFLGKCLSDGYSLARFPPSDLEDFRVVLNRFYSDHTFCNELHYVHNETQFTLGYEFIEYDTDGIRVLDLSGLGYSEQIWSSIDRVDNLYAEGINPTSLNNGIVGCKDIIDAYKITEFIYESLPYFSSPDEFNKCRVRYTHPQDLTSTKYFAFRGITKHADDFFVRILMYDDDSLDTEEKENFEITVTACENGDVGIYNYDYATAALKTFAKIVGHGYTSVCEFIIHHCLLVLVKIVRYKLKYLDVKTKKGNLDMGEVNLGPEDMEKIEKNAEYINSINISESERQNDIVSGLKSYDYAKFINEYFDKNRMIAPESVVNDLATYIVKKIEGNVNQESDEDTKFKNSLNNLREYFNLDLDDILPIGDVECSKDLPKYEDVYNIAHYLHDSVKDIESNGLRYGGYFYKAISIDKTIISDDSCVFHIVFEVCKYPLSSQDEIIVIFFNIYADTSVNYYYYSIEDMSRMKVYNFFSKDSNVITTATRNCVRLLTYVTDSKFTANNIKRGINNEI